MRLCVLGIFVVGERELQKWVAQNFKFWAMMLGLWQLDKVLMGLLLAASVLMGMLIWFLT
jgi:hypothetical protein